MKIRALISAFAVALVFTAGCTGEFIPLDPDPNANPPPVDPGIDPIAQQEFTATVQPILLDTNRLLGSCARCHQVGGGPDGVDNGPAFMGDPGDNLNAILTYSATLVIPQDPINSRLQNRGAHAGDALPQAEIDAISNWINLL